MNQGHQGHQQLGTKTKERENRFGCEILWGDPKSRALSVMARLAHQSVGKTPPSIVQWSDSMGPCFTGSYKCCVLVPLSLGRATHLPDTSLLTSNKQTISLQCYLIL